MVNSEEMGSKELVVKCKGLPYSCSESDLKNFLGDSGIDKVDIAMRDGKASGDATVYFNNDRDYNEALKKDREHMGHRYIEVFPANEDRPSRPRGGPGGGGGGGGRYFERNADGPRERPDRGGYGYRGGRGDNMPPDMGNYNGEGVVRLRGMPFNARERDVFDFFAPLPILPDGVLLPDERNAPKSNGEAFVVFEDQGSAEMALQRHMKNMQHRYIEVFAASYQDMIRFCQDNRIRVPRPAAGGYGPPGRGGGYGDYGPPGPGYGPNGPEARGGYGSYPGGGPGTYPDRRGPPPFEAGYGPQAVSPSRDPYGRGGDPWAGRGGPEPPAPRGSADPYGRGAPHPPSTEAFARVDVNPYGRPAPPPPPQDEPYGRPRGYAAEDPYARPAARGPDPYDRAPAPTGDAYGRGRAEPYARPAAETWREDAAPARDAPRGAGGPGAGYGEEAGGWEGYGYGSDYRQQSGGGPMRREREAAGPGPGAGAWREEAPRGRERPGQKYVLKMRGVPFRAVEGDVYEFFEPIRPARVEIVREPGGRPSGEARVEFDSRKDYDDALLKDKQYMGARYVELFPDFGGRY